MTNLENAVNEFRAMIVAREHGHICFGAFTMAKQIAVKWGVD